jgi:hypothetical protein
MLKNDPDLTGQAVQILQTLLGPKRLKLLHPAMGSEDFPYFAARAPLLLSGGRTPGAGAMPSTPRLQSRRSGAALRPHGCGGAAGLPGRAGVPSLAPQVRCHRRKTRKPCNLV